MAAEHTRTVSPPLPPDPSSPPSKVSILQPPLVGQQYPATPATPSTETQTLKRVDSLRSAPPSDFPISQQRQPIKDAVNHAANSVFEHSPVTNQLDPEFIKQLTQQVTASVTEKVLQNLQAAGATPTPQQTHFPPPPPPAQSSQEPRSPARSSIDPFVQQYTPPTPDRTFDIPDDRDVVSSSPEPPQSDTGSSFSQASIGSARSRGSHGETPRPSYPNPTENPRRRSYTSRRRSGTGTSSNHDNEPDVTAREGTRRDSREMAFAYDGTPRTRARPTRVPSDVEETPLEKFWQPLFDNGNPTMRLGQFLRGLALHLIEDYEPKHSIVVTPAKMLRFMNETKIQEEHYPWDIIFGDKMSAPSISEMYQKLKCQHHLVQDQYHRPPTIPGLTPLGFDQFMTCLIQAHPQREYDRVAKAVMDMPISNADNKSERFPKELSKRLFPTEPSIQAQQRLLSSLSHERYVVSLLKGVSPMPPPPPPPAGPPGSIPERERNPYSHSSSAASNAFDDEDLADQPSIQIERERKPYTAREGMGKSYADDDRSPPTAYKAEPPRNGTRTARTNSGAPTASAYNNNGLGDPMNIPMRNPHRMSAGQSNMPTQSGNGAFSKSARRSPPPVNPFNRNEPALVGSMPTSQYTSNPYADRSREQYNESADDESTNRYRSRSRVDRPGAGHQLDDEPRGYPIPNHNVPLGSGYEYGSGPVGGPPIGQQSNAVPVGSYPTRRPTMGAGTEDRRRSMYNAPAGYGGGDGGTDGYGSFANTNGAYQPQPSQSYGASGQH